MGSPGDGGTDVREGNVTVEGGARLWYRAEGPAGAPALLLSNSLGTDLRLWDPQVPALAARFHVVCYDSRGHGRSDAPPGPYTLDMLGRDALDLLDALAIERAHVCGLSLGGMVALWLAIHHPARVGRVVLANTGARIGSEASWDERVAAVRAGGMRAIRDTVVGRFLSERFRAEHPEETARIAAMLEVTPAEGYIGACAALRDADLRERFAGVHAPALVLGGALDQSTPPELAHALHAGIAGSELHLFDGVAHLSNVERPEEFTSRMVEFLAESGT
jgi:3-oxoadipate enol-lactonase